MENAPAREPITAIRASYVVVPEGRSHCVLRNKTVILQGDRIAEICDRYERPVDVDIDAEGRLLTPGFINAHVHVGAATYVRGLCEDRDLLPGSAFYHCVVPLIAVGAANFSLDEFAAVIEWDMLEMLKKGSTTILEENFDHYEVLVQVAQRLGIRAYLSPTYPSGHGNIGYIKNGRLEYDAPAEGAVSAGLQRNINLHAQFNGCANDRIRVRLSPTGPDTCPPEVLRETRKAADRLGCGISIHAAHHQREFDICRTKYNATPIEHLANTGILGPDAVVTHCTFTNENDRKLLAESKSTVAHCSYRKSREAVIGPFWDYLQKGINVALGTDSYSSDITETIRMAVVLGKIKTGRVGAPTAADAFDATTLAGARALGRDDLGQIKPGAKADLVLIDLTKTHNCPVIDPIKNFVYYSSGTDVETVMVDGKIVIDRGRSVNTDEDRLRERVRSAAGRIWRLADELGVVDGLRAAVTSRPA
jgi:cytosine/adenosine deaminase-related metal-dependent hydrolase